MSLRLSTPPVNERPKWQLPFAAYVTGTFMLTAAMTALIVASVVAVAWAGNRGRVITGDDIVFALLVAGVVAIGLAWFVGAYFASSIVSPVAELKSAADALAAGDLSARTNMHGDDDLSQLGETFDEMAASIERDRDLERQLVADVAHELRTPLQAIQATVEAIEDGVFEADSAHLAVVSGETRRLSRLVDALLTINRLENGTIVLKMEPVDLSRVVGELVLANRALMAEAGLRLDCTIAPNVEVMGDRDFLHVAITNLLSNAVRYTPAGGQVSIVLECSDGFARVSVADNGIGISAADQAHVFTRFWRADAARTRVGGGLGIGLAQTKIVVEQHGGTIAVSAAEGLGSTFTITLPLQFETPRNTGSFKAITESFAKIRSSK